MRYLAALTVILGLAGCQSAQTSELALPQCVSECTMIVIYKDTEALFERGGNSPTTSLPSIPGL